MNRFILTTLLFVSFHLFSWGQETNEITLDNYLYTDNHTFIGHILPVGQDENLIQLKLKGKDKSRFQIKNGNELHLINSSNNKNDFYFEIQIQAKIEGNKVVNSFKIVKDDFIRNGVVAHRGAWKNQNVSQNSIGSLDSAIMIGCEGVEFDIWLTKDGVPVVSHDPIIGGKVIKESTSAEMVKVPLKNGEFVPTLEEYIQGVIVQNKTRLFLEIKPFDLSEETLLELTRKAVAMVHKYNAQAWVEYISFGFEAIQEVKRLDPTTKQAYLGSDKTVEELKEAGITGLDFNYGMFSKDPSIVDRAKQTGIKTNFWTVNEKAQMLLLLEAGVDHITTDEPELLLETLRQLKK